MSVILDQLVQPASMFMVAALLLGGLFDRVPPGFARNCATGFACGSAAAVLIALSPDAVGFGDGRGPLVLVGAFIAGPVGLAGVLTLPLGVILVEGTPDALVACAGLVILALAGLGASLARVRLGIPLQRQSILWLALLSPLAFAATTLAPATQVAAVDPLSFWLPFGTLLFGFAVVTEHSRGEAKRARLSEVRFRQLTDTVSVPLFRSQLEQHFRMHQRYGHEYSYMLVSIDDGAGLRKRLRADEWDLVRAAVGANVRRAVREPDVCAAVDFDRFAVILPHASLPFALPVAERVQRAVAKALANLSSGDVTVSIGVAEVDGTSQPAEIEAAAEGELFLANMRQRKGAIGPWMDWPTTAPVRSFPGRRGDEGPADERAYRPTRLVALADTPPAEEPCVA